MSKGHWLLVLWFSASLAGASSSASSLPLLTNGSHSLAEQPQQGGGGTAPYAYNYSVHVPTAGGVGGKYPVAILLHGNGGNGASFLQPFLTQPSLAPLRASHILVAPDGPDESWNIVAEASTRNDVFFVGTTLLNDLARRGNVEPSFTLIGHSNGAALTNRILIENDDARIVAAITDVCQLNTNQYHGGAFYVGGPDNNYAAPKAVLTSRRLLQVTGKKDDVIPAAGGASVIPGKPDGTFLQLNRWNASAFAYAKAYGFSGVEATVADDGTVESVSYLGGRVQALNYKNAEHGVVASDADAPSTAVGNAAAMQFLDSIVVPTSAPTTAALGSMMSDGSITTARASSPTLIALTVLVALLSL